MEISESPPKMESSTHESPPNPNPSAHTFESPHPIYAMAVSSSLSSFPRLALGSFIEDLANRVDIVSFDAESLSFDPQISFDHPYPPTKLMFHPNSTSSLLASSGESLNIWRTVGSSVELRSSLKNRAGEFCAPLTSFDWNEAEPRRIGTSSIDTTCTVWDVEAGAVETQLIAHDKEVYDIAWGDAGVFASVSADGSVRIFDLRDKEHSTIVYESPDAAPILRLAWNRADLRYIAGVVADSSRVVVLDIRSPAVPVAELARHRGAVNAVAWGPRDPRCLCSAGDDGRALMWDLPGMTTTEGGIDPVMMYTTGAEINQLQWAAAQPEWIGIAFANKVQLLRV